MRTDFFNPKYCQLEALKADPLLNVKAALRNYSRRLAEIDAWVGWMKEIEPLDLGWEGRVADVVMLSKARQDASVLRMQIGRMAERLKVVGE